MTLETVTLFSGGGLKALGARQAGFNLVGAVEYNEAIASVYADNLGPCVTVGKVEEVSPLPYVGIDALLASPVCTRASVANANRGESEVDLAAAEGVCHWLRVTRPKCYVMENVTQYRAFQSYRRIMSTLYELGYLCTDDTCNAADYGVPQTRRRMIVRALLGQMPPPLKPNHYNPLAASEDGGLFAEDTRGMTPWVGWYAAIEDILHTLPESKFADWQLARLDPQLCSMVLGYNTLGGLPKNGAKKRFIGRQVLPVLRQTIGETAFQQWEDGVIRGFEKANLLQQRMHESRIQKQGVAGRNSRRVTPPFSHEDTAGAMRNLWQNESSGRSPQGRQPVQQLSEELAAYLSELSHEGSQPARHLLNLRESPQQQGVLQQALSSFQEIWRSAVHQNQRAGDETPADYYPGCSCRSCQDKKMGGEFVSTLSQPAKGSERAVLIEGDAAGDRPPTCGTSAEPAFTLKTASGGRVHRAFLCGVQGEGGDLYREGGTPSPTVTTAHDAAKYRAFLISDQTTATTRVGCRAADLPSQTVDTRPASKTRAWLEQGRVVAMTPRALARFMSCPDTYRLPTSKALASTVLGNGLPCLLAQRIMEQLKEYIQ